MSACTFLRATSQAAQMPDIRPPRRIWPERFVIAARDPAAKGRIATAIASGFAIARGANRDARQGLLVPPMFEGMPVRHGPGQLGAINAALGRLCRLLEQKSATRSRMSRAPRTRLV